MEKNYVIICGDNAGQILKTSGPYTEEEAIAILDKATSLCGEFKSNAMGCHSWEMGDYNGTTLTMYKMNDSLQDIFDEAEEHGYEYDNA